MVRFWDRCRRLGRKSTLRVMRKKSLPEERRESPLKRCMVAFDAYCLCMGAMIRSVFWELPNETTRTGSNIVISLMVAVGATSIGAFTYCELASLLSSTSGAYDYVYHYMGELPAFLVGWSVVLNFTIRLISVCSYFGEVLEHALFNQTALPANYSFMFVAYEEEWYLLRVKHSTDYYSLVLILMCSVFSQPLKVTKVINNLFVVYGLVSAISAFGMLWFMVDWWEVEFKAFASRDEVTSFGYGCYLMYMCFQQFDVLLCLGDEIQNPKETIAPIITTILKHVTLGYFCSLFILSAADSSYLYSSDVRLPVPTILASFGFTPKSLLIVIGCICTVFSTMYSKIFFISRVLYTMSKDGLLLKCFSITSYTRTPLVSSLALCVITIVCTLFLKPTLLIVRTARCGTLFVKIMLSICLIISRYQCVNEKTSPPKSRWVLINYRNAVLTPTRATEKVAIYCTLIALLCAIIINFVIHLFIFHDEKKPMGVMLILSMFFLIFSSIVLQRQPQNDRSDIRTKLFGVPFSNIIAIFWDVSMMNVAGFPPFVLQAIWISLGVVHYFTYSVFHSKQRGIRLAETIADDQASPSSREAENDMTESQTSNKFE